MEGRRDERVTDHGVFLSLLLVAGGHSGRSPLPESDSGQFDEGSHAGGNEGRLLIVISKFIITLHLVTSISPDNIGLRGIIEISVLIIHHRPTVTPASGEKILYNIVHCTIIPMPNWQYKTRLKTFGSLLSIYLPKC